MILIDGIFTDFEKSFVKSYNDKLSKNAPKNKTTISDRF